MAALNYNKDIFTNVRKWDNENSYLGVLVSGKLNQYNGQGYPIIDAIDIDWDGAWVNNLKTYLYTTEDLIRCLNISYANFNNYIAGSYLGRVLIRLNEQIDYGDSYSLAYTSQNVDYVLNLIDEINFRIEHIQDITLDRSNFYKVDYDDIVVDGHLRYTNDNARKYYIQNLKTKEYDIVNEYFIVNNPEEKYYINIIDNVLQDMNELQELYDFIGYSYYDIENNSYTYTGLLDRLNNYDIDLENIHEELDETTYIANNAYGLAYTTYTYIDDLRKQVIINRDNIGYHTSYNIYKPIQDLSEDEFSQYLFENNNKVYIYDDESKQYVITDYNATYTGQYYTHYDVIYGTGIEREIELLDRKIYDNSYLLYKLDVESKDPNYFDIEILPNNPGSQERTIKAGVVQSYVNSNTGEANKGIITNSALTNSFAYVFDWNILKKE